MLLLFFLYPDSLGKHIETLVIIVFLIAVSFSLGSFFYFLAWKLRIDVHGLVLVSLALLALGSIAPLFVSTMWEKSPFFSSITLGLLYSLLVYVGEVEYEESQENTPKV